MKHFLSVVAFMVVTFAVQGTSHFVLNHDHYAAISFLRPEPILPMGFGAMIIQAVIMTVAFERIFGVSPSIRSGLTFSLAFGIFLGSYMWLAEPAKYTVPSTADWISVELPMNMLQFIVYGVLIAAIHRQFGKKAHVVTA